MNKIQRIKLVWDILKVNKDIKQPDLRTAKEIVEALLPDAQKRGE